MLSSLSSRDITEWRAYELLNGPVGSAAYSEEALASMHEMLQHIGRILIASNAEDQSSVPELIHYPRPFEFLVPPEETDEE